MFLVYFQRILQFVCFLQGIAHCVKTSISHSLCGNCFSIKCGDYLSCNSLARLLEVHFINAVRLSHILKSLFEQIKDFIWMKLFMKVIRNTLGCVTHCLTHFWRKVQTVFCFQNVAYAAFSRLAVDTDNICIIITSNICGINWQIRNCPAVRIFFLDPVHTFGNCILMGTRKCCKNKCSTVWTSLSNCHSRATLIHLADVRHIGEVKLRIYSLGIHVHSKCYNINITSTLSVSKKSSLDAVCSGKNSHFRICHTTTSVIVRM